MSRAVAAALLLACAGTAPACVTTISCGPPALAVILGEAQDAGRPHLGCERACCAGERAAGTRRNVAALGVLGRDGAWWLVDATPDLPEQIHRMGSMPRGILLTHAHVGHYTGLIYLGREGMNARGMPVHCSEAMAEFLRSNAPWDQLVRLGNVELRPFRSGETFTLAEGLAVEAMRVPHRDEYADTHAFGFLRERQRALLYLPDIDRWEDWADGFAAALRNYPRWIVDGSFYSGAELDGRDLREIPHPAVTHSMDLLQQEVRAGRLEVWFTHMNHTNPLWEPASPESRATASRGFRVARAGDTIRAFTGSGAAW